LANAEKRLAALTVELDDIRQQLDARHGAG
jgi:hypothetical protein